MRLILHLENSEYLACPCAVSRWLQPGQLRIHLLGPYSTPFTIERRATGKRTSILCRGSHTSRRDRRVNTTQIDGFSILKYAQNLEIVQGKWFMGCGGGEEQGVYIEKGFLWVNTWRRFWKVTQSWMREKWEHRMDRRRGCLVSTPTNLALLQPARKSSAKPVTLQTHMKYLTIITHIQKDKMKKKPKNLAQIWYYFPPQSWQAFAFFPKSNVRTPCLKDKLRYTFFFFLILCISL